MLPAGNGWSPDAAITVPVVVSVVADELDPLQPEQARDLVDDGREDLLGCGAGGDEGRDSAERGLLVAEAAHLVVRLRVRERGGDQVGERGQSFFGAGGKRLRRAAWRPA